MLKISTKSTYAIRALLHITRYGNNKAIKIQEISEKENIPLPYLEQIFAKLKKSGLVRALRGPQGGILLYKNPDDISLSDIVVALEGPINPVLCSIPDKQTPTCHHVDGCESRMICCELDGAIIQILRKHTIGSLSRKAESAEEIVTAE